MIDVIDFPQLRRHAQIIKPVTRRELIAANLEPFLSLIDARDDLRVDVQAQRGRPRRGVFDITDPLPVPCEEHRARAFQSLLGQHRLIRLQFELRLNRAVRPDDARDVGLRVLAQPEMKNWRGNDLLLSQQPGADFDLAPDAEGINSLVAGGFGGAGADGLVVIVLRRAVNKLRRFDESFIYFNRFAGKPDQIELPIAVYVKSAR